MVDLERGRATQTIPALMMVLLAANLAWAQAPAAATPPANKDPWAFNLTVDGYIVPNEDGFVSPILTADRSWLHLETRYNYENLRTGSLWVGYNFSAGKKLVFDITPMVGGVFGRTTGIAPGCEASLTYKKVELSVSNEYVFDTASKSGNFYYSWPQLTYSPLKWLQVGAVAQHTRAYQTNVDVQRGFLVGVSFKSMEFTTYIFDPGEQTTAVLEVGYSF